MDKKTFRNVEVKDETKGEIRAVFSTLDVVDKDGDITVKGAMQDGAPVRISAYNHKSWEGALPVGKGVIHEVGNEVVFEGKFFMNTQGGRDTFEVVKEMGELQEYSYGFDVVDSEPATDDSKSAHGPGHRRTLRKLKVHEISPVLLGAGIGTRTLATKEEKKSLADQLAEVVASVKAVRERTAEVMAMRTEKGKASPLGEDSGALIEEVQAELKSLSELLSSRAGEPDPDLETANKELQAAYLRFVQSEL